MFMADRHELLRIDATGRIAIPSSLRAQACIPEGGELLVGRVEDGRLILETRANIKRRLKEAAATHGTRKAVGRLFAGRRADLDWESSHTS
jgi:AbrB family looped-hinge helix DNA binding protein